MSQFIRENRYVVLKGSDLQAMGLTESELEFLSDLCSKVDQHRRDAGKPDLQCVVVEKDWPEYEPTWAAIERRMNTGAASIHCLKLEWAKVGQTVCVVKPNSPRHNQIGEIWKVRAYDDNIRISVSFDGDIYSFELADLRLA